MYLKTENYEPFSHSFWDEDASLSLCYESLLLYTLLSVEMI